LNRCFMYVHIQISKIILRWYLICQFLTLLWLSFSSKIVAIPCMLAKEKSWKKKVIQTSLLLLMHGWERMYHYARGCLLVLIIPVIKWLDNKEWMS
jgi:hypothetical protein